MARALIADSHAPIADRLAAAAEIHRRRYGLPSRLADAEAVATAYARRQRALRRLAAAYGVAA